MSILNFFVEGAMLTLFNFFKPVFQVQKVTILQIKLSKIIYIVNAYLLHKFRL